MYIVSTEEYNNMNNPAQAIGKSYINRDREF